MPHQNKSYYPNVLCIGANHRKVGKTSLVQNIVRHFRQDKIIAVKIAAYDDAGDLRRDHGTAELIVKSNETEQSDIKDSGRFKKAGADKSFFIAGMEADVRKKVSELLEKYNGRPFVIESNWFALHFTPGYILLLEDKNARSKESFLRLMNSADSIVPPGTINELALNFWQFSEGKWEIPGKR